MIPELNGKLDGASMRVPTPNVSLVDFKFVAKRKTTVEEINDAIIEATQVEPAEGHPRGDEGEARLLRPEPRLRRPRPCALDQTKVIDGTFGRVVSWYDNEWGFSNRMADTAVAMGKLG